MIVLELLRPLLFNAKFVDANGIELYRSTVFAGTMHVMLIAIIIRWYIRRTREFFQKSVSGYVCTVSITMFLTGYVGLLTGMKTGAFSITVDTRFDSTLWSGMLLEVGCMNLLKLYFKFIVNFNYTVLTDPTAGLYKWFDGDHTGKFLSFTTRLGKLFIHVTILIIYWISFVQCSSRCFSSH